VTALARPRLARGARLSGDARTGKPLLLGPELGLLLDPTASAIISLCDGTRDIAAIVGELHRIHPDDDRDAIQRDVECFLQALAHRGLVE
jgi:pyrroloquinoline quinone biosynthesis protein D